MTLPFPLPDWLPWWVPLVVLVPALLYLLLFLVMPFSVFGLKARLDLIDARLDEIQGEIRRLGPRLPEPSRYAGVETPAAFGRAAQPPQPARVAEAADERPPPHMDAPPSFRPEPAAPPRIRPAPQDGPRRVEPRLDWPRS